MRAGLRWHAAQLQASDDRAAPAAAVPAELGRRVSQLPLPARVHGNAAQLQAGGCPAPGMPQGLRRHAAQLQAGYCPTARMPERYDGQVPGLQADRMSERHDGHVSGLQADREGMPQGLSSARRPTAGRLSSDLPNARKAQRVSIRTASRSNARKAPQASIRTASPSPARKARRASIRTASRSRARKARRASIRTASRSRCPKGTTGKYPDCKRIVLPPKECPEGLCRHAAELQADRTEMPERHDRDLSQLRADKHSALLDAMERSRADGTCRESDSRLRRNPDRQKGPPEHFHWQHTSSPVPEARTEHMQTATSSLFLHVGLF